MAETLGGLSNEDFMGVMEKLNSIKFDKTSVYNGTDSTSTSLAASANALKTVKDLTDTNTTAISQLNSDFQNCYRFSGGTSIPENADMKSSQYLIPGNYYCESNITAVTLSNCPFDSAFLLKVEYSVGGNAQYIRQTFKQFDNNKIISRVYFVNESKWQDETQYITNADLPLKANVWQLESNGGSDSFSYSHSCLIFASRGNSYGVYMCDNWNAVATIHNLENLSVSVSNHTVTVANNRSSGAIGVIVIGNTNLSY